MKTWQQWIAGACLAGLVGLTAVGGEAKQGDGKPKPPIDEKVAADPRAAAMAADLLEAAYQGKDQPEGMRMLIAILRGSGMGPGEGWFGPAQSRYTWEWLARLHGLDPAKGGGIPRQAFKGTDAQFGRLDRDRDGLVRPEDLDWSDNSPFLQQAAMVRGWFRKLNAAGDGQLTRKEWQDFFDKAAKGKETMSFDDLREALLEATARPAARPMPKMMAALRAEMMRTTLVRGLFAGEIGSLNEGPKVGQPAPNFTLKTVDGKETIQLANVVGKKPVVLVFGNYTCGPFTAMYPGLEPVHQRFKDEATFLMVYTREAHPTDGWHMGADVKQPTTLEERVGVAQKFCKRVTPTMPVLVDEMNDPVGHAYSGMPSRLYVIDGRGVVAYKSGRGPFGFRVGELEQAVVMGLLEQRQATAKGR